MASGPQHYVEAEQLLTRALKCPESSVAQVLVTAALVHATLASAAAIAMGEYFDDVAGAGMPAVDVMGWRMVAAVESQQGGGRP